MDDKCESPHLRSRIVIIGKYLRVTIWENQHFWRFILFFEKTNFWGGYTTSNTIISMKSSWRGLSFDVWYICRRHCLEYVCVELSVDSGMYVLIWDSTQLYVAEERNPLNFVAIFKFCFAITFELDFSGLCIIHQMKALVKSFSTIWLDFV